MVGGGPAGLKAAAIAAERGHRVTLMEKEAQLGGQALIAQLLPGRAEFGGIVTNLARECEIHGVNVRRGVEVTKEIVATEAPDVVIAATGAVEQRRTWRAWTALMLSALGRSPGHGQCRWQGRRL